MSTLVVSYSTVNVPLCTALHCRSMYELTPPSSSSSPRSFFLTVPGQSGRFSSPHYASSSALAAWGSGDLLSLSFLNTVTDTGADSAVELYTLQCPAEDNNLQSDSESNTEEL